MYKLYQDKNWLTEQYWGFDLTMNEIAKISGCGDIYYWMDKYSIPRRTNSQFSREAWSKPEVKKIQKEARINSWKNTQRREVASQRAKERWKNSREDIIRSICKHYENPENRKKAKERSRKSAKKISKVMKKRFKDPKERERISVLTKKAMSRQDVKEKMRKEGLKRRGKTLKQLGHKPNCTCGWCKQKRGDVSWITEEVRNKKSITLKKRMKENPEKWGPIYKRVGEEAFKSNIKNRPYIWNNVHFMSSLEMKCAKMLLTEPIDGINCNIKVNGCFIDFFPQEYDKLYQGMFVEYHPWDSSGLTPEEYYNQRKDVINSSEYKGIELIVITNLEDINKREKK